ncbi:MAG: TonB-dependent receptor [Alphaproteobacteria bacterium]|uniref:TonB-dependent receptor n=1 Tax=Candidatus Nitrobium versatile TaxID=2884831 RepID=A0A953JFF2_9BACT|nr:TonB-dependent receptor [Candidatus Nitrobium versatile]
MGVRSLMFLIGAALTAVPFLFPLTGFAQTETRTAFLHRDEESLIFQEIPSIYGASRFEQEVYEAPSSVSIITADEIRKYGYRNLADVLHGVRGFFVTYDRNYHYIGVRGFARPGDFNTRILLLVDGHRLNDNIYEQASIGTLSLIDVDLIDRIEIIRGPGSSLYGSNAFFGVISIITRSGRHLKGFEASGEVGSFSSRQGRISYGNRYARGMETLLSGTAYESRGQSTIYYREFDDPVTNGGKVENGDGDRFHSLFAKQSFRDFTLEAAFVRRQKEIPTASYGTVFNDSRNQTIDSQSFLDLRYEHSYSGQFEAMARVFYDHYSYDGDYVYDRAAPDGTGSRVLNTDYAQGDWWGAEVQLTGRFHERHRIVVGAEYRITIRQEQGNYDTEVYLDDRRKSRNWAFYFQDEVSLHDALVLNAGVRLDQYQTFGSTVTPRAALIYRPFERTYLKFLYGKAFRAPNAYENYYRDFGVIKANPDLRPEMVSTYEAILERYFGENYRGALSAFYYRIHDLISQQTDPSDGLLVFRNVDEVKARGLELEVEGKWDGGWEGRIRYALQKAQDGKSGERLTNSPEHVASFAVTVPLTGQRLFSSLEEQYVSRRKTRGGGTTGSYFLTNITLFGRGVVKGLEMSGSVYNLFDTKYEDPGGAEHLQDAILQDGRSFRVKLTWNF